MEIYCLGCKILKNLTFDSKISALDIINSLFHCFPLSGAILFASLCWICSKMLDVTADEIVTTNDNNLKDKKMNSWKSQYLMIVNLIEHIQNCFGFFLLIFIPSEFLRLILTSYYLMLDLQNRDKAPALYNALLLLIYFFLFCIVVYAPFRVQKRVRYYCIYVFKAIISCDLLFLFYRHLLWCWSFKTFLHMMKKCSFRWYLKKFINWLLLIWLNTQQIDSFTMKFAKRFPTFSANGFFQVNLQLISKVSQKNITIAPTLINVATFA